MEYGIQLFSVRDAFPGDIKGTLKALGEMGYSFVETAGFHGADAETFADNLKASGMSLIATHTPWEELAENFGETVKFHKAIGNKNIVIPAADLSTRQSLDSFIDFVNGVQPKLREQGIDLHYHNHTQELIANKDGIIPAAELMSRTNLLLEVDTFFVYAVGQDPVDFLTRHKDRVRMIHLKDGLTEHEGRPLGQGSAPIEKVYRYALNRLAIIVESETLQPDGLTEARLCIEYLRQLED
ncbi:MAG: sugar phosphate isomerase/epimerase [Clostridiales bacterium]|jgi:sugar phosphate isomerase/epimerase|nr:sugar phosphate isomerase/epimerase [Clostridiales bacterium]